MDNMYETALAGLQSSIDAENCLITNSGINIFLVRGGQYTFKHCTVSSFSTLYVSHKNPVLYINNWDSTANTLMTYDLNASFTNNIFWGDYGTVDDEVILSSKGNNLFQVTFDHNLYKAINTPAFSVDQGNIMNEDPRFDSVNIERRIFDFHIARNISPVIDKGIAAGVPLDLDGKTRKLPPDMGCYEND